MTETWFNISGDEASISQMTPPNYTTDSFPRETRGGGICITSKNVIGSCLKNASNVDFASFELSKSDMLFYNNHFTVFCIYRPPPSKENMQTASKFLNDFEVFLDVYTLTLKRFLIIGDINLHFDEKDETYVKQMLHVLHTRNLTQLVNVPTHRSRHIIDWIITRNDVSNSIFKIDVTDICISDHFSFHLKLIL